MFKYIIALILLLTLIVFLSCAVVYNKTRGKFFRKLFHDILGWHIPTDKISFDGCSRKSTCHICGKEILEDSQGNWFNIEDYTKNNEEE